MDDITVSSHSCLLWLNAMILSKSHQITIPQKSGCDRRHRGQLAAALLHNLPKLQFKFEIIM
ncbi:hypothetical protein HanIR_Chr04g0204331 [Helianthus annuus]|nr:hypothetical protein HanIR_Chr04g0204331 [Helianthus annuus]